MIEIILSFFAVIGITLMALIFCDFLFFRKFDQTLPLIVDLRTLSESEVIETFELITTVRQKTSGKAAIGKIIVLVRNDEAEKRKLANHYMKVFHIPGTLYDDEERQWQEDFYKN